MTAEPEHTGVSASWCPICGDCTCPRWTDGHWIDDPDALERAWSRRGRCPLHSGDTDHCMERHEPALDVERIARLLDSYRVSPEEREALTRALDALDEMRACTHYHWPSLRWLLGRIRFRRMKDLIKELYDVRR